MQNKKLYFPGLNSLRFIAAFLVVIHHAEQRKMHHGLENEWNSFFIGNIGGLAVTFFFVLSGYLITYLLLCEKDKSGIQIRKFYIRRLLRIWPLYYFILFLAFFILPNIDIFITKRIADTAPLRNNLFYLYLIMLPNIPLILRQGVEYVSHFWSVGVEEQFYLFWPWIIKKSQKVLNSLITVVVIMVAIRTFLKVSHQFYDFPTYFDDFLYFFRVQCMAIGGIVSYFLYTNNQRLLNLIYHTYAQLIPIILIPILFIFEIKIPFIQHEVFSLMFAILIINVSTNSKSILKLENKLFKHLGNVSYGVYMYHPVALIIAMHFAERISKEYFIFNISYYILSIILVILISTISYEVFEKKILHLKSKFAIIKT